MDMVMIKIHKEAMDIVKSGLAIEENILKMSLCECKKDLESLKGNTKCQAKSLFKSLNQHNMIRDYFSDVEEKLDVKKRK